MKNETTVYIKMINGNEWNIGALSTTNEFDKERHLKTFPDTIFIEKDEYDRLNHTFETTGHMYIEKNEQSDILDA